MKDFIPSQKVLENYAKILVNFALNSGAGIKKGETVIVQATEYSKPLYVEILKAVWKAGGHVIPRYTPDNDATYNIDKNFFAHAKEEQLLYFPEKFYKGLVDQADHNIYILCETDPHAMKGINPEKIMKRGKAMKPYQDMRMKKEHEGKFTWTLALYGTPAMAKEARLSLKAYWDQIIQACFLDAKNPIAEWKKVYKKVEEYRQKLNKLNIDKVHVLGKDVDLWITIGEKRQWLGGSGRNIPSFELFTSPDWRGTDGWIKFNEPLYRYGNLIEGIELEFKNGKVVKSNAKTNEKVLKSMIATTNADKVGEFSMTDKRFSKITKFMANTLFDENMGGENGNTHIALGMSYVDTYEGDPSKLSKEAQEKLGYNDSSVHTDIISTTPRIVTAHFKDGAQKVIYKDGQFTL
ncbi:MAG: aminopeptidase [bacterium]|nr:aminopeptidase [bacterium]